MANAHGGARTGSGRKPNPYIDDPICEELRQRIIAALPEIIDKQIEIARAGNSCAAKLLIDRIMGRPGVAPTFESADPMEAILSRSGVSLIGNDTAMNATAGATPPAYLGSRAERRANLKKRTEIKLGPAPQVAKDHRSMIDAMRNNGAHATPFPL